MLVMMLSGLPVCACSTTTSCQPSFRRFPCNGGSYEMFNETRCGAGESDGPTLSARLLLSCNEPLFPAPVPSYEFVSVDFESVYEPDSCRPFVRRRFAVTQRPL